MAARDKRGCLFAPHLIVYACVRMQFAGCHRSDVLDARGRTRPAEEEEDDEEE
jgi:hypothetical protein